MPTCVTVPPLTSLTTMAPVPANTRANVPSASAASLRIPSSSAAASPAPAPAAVADLFHEAQPLVQQGAHAQVHEPVVDAVAVPPGGEDAQVGQPLQLVGDGLGLHAERGGEVGDAQFVGPDQGVQ